MAARARPVDVVTGEVRVAVDIEASSLTLVARRYESGPAERFGGSSDRRLRGSTESGTASGTYSARMGWLRRFALAASLLTGALMVLAAWLTVLAPTATMLGV